MRFHRFELTTTAAIALLWLSWVDPTASADAIEGYTVTNLGSGPITMATSGGNMVPIAVAGANTSYTPFVSVSNGQATYPFPVTPDARVVQTQGNTPSFPLPVAAPVNSPDAYGNPANVYSFAAGPLMNANRVAVAVDIAGVNGHESWGTAYVVHQNADGSWGTPTVLWAGGSAYNGGMPTAGGVSIVGINNLNQVLGTTTPQFGSSPQEAVVYDLAKQSLTAFSTVTDSAGIVYTNLNPYAIDDQGRILLQGTAFPSGALDTLLLTPAGVPLPPSRRQSRARWR